MLAVVVLVAGAGVWWWGQAHQEPPQIITLSNGERYQFAGVKYGTRVVPPTVAAELVSWLPTRLANSARNYMGARVTQWGQGQKFDTPQPIVWFRRLGTNAPIAMPSGAMVRMTAASQAANINARLVNEAGVDAGATGFTDFGGHVTWSYFAFPVVPRRSHVLQCILSNPPFLPSASGTFPPSIFVGRVSFRNPLYSRYPQWEPEPIPATRRDGNLEVHLNDSRTGRPDAVSTILSVLTLVGSNVSRASGSPRIDEEPNAEMWFDISLKSSKAANEAWVLQRAELSDATGNVLRDTDFNRGILLFDNALHSQLSGKSAYIEYLPGTLWPDEAAWLLRLKVKRAVGFAPEELVTFTNVPVPAMGTTNTIGLTKIVAGTRTVLTEFVRVVPTNTFGTFGSQYSYIRMELPDKPEGMALDFVNITTDAGMPEFYARSPGDYSTVKYLKSIPVNAKTVDITMAVQRTRSVEFLVKPPKPE